MTVEANGTPIQMLSSFEANRGLRHWGKQRLPYTTDVNRKLSNTETLALISSVNSNNLKHLDDNKSHLNDIFKRCLKLSVRSGDNTGI